MSAWTPQVEVFQREITYTRGDSGKSQHLYECLLKVQIISAVQKCNLVIKEGFNGGFD